MDVDNIFGNKSSIQEDNSTSINNFSIGRKIGLDRWHLILPYSLILFLAITGNLLVIVTLVVNKRMRTVTNVFLFNLAIGDLLLGVFCMPFTLTGVLLREFIFGSALCSLIPYFQAVSVSVSAWTLVSMSVERYFAICHPLKSREWQTLSHAYKMIAAVWVGSMICMLPILVLSRLQNVKKTGRYKCRESWPSDVAEKCFTIFLDIILLLLPLIIMSATYCRIIQVLWKAMGVTIGEDTEQDMRHGWKDSPNINKRSRLSKQQTFESTTSVSSKIFTLGSKSNGHNYTPATQFRKSNTERSVLQKKRIIKMLFVVVLEFFICWTPLYALNTVTLFYPSLVYSAIGYRGISFFQLLAYTSSCCNPVTYCFMNSKFRESLCRIFPCRQPQHRTHTLCQETATDYQSKI